MHHQPDCRVIAHMRCACVIRFRAHLRQASTIAWAMPLGLQAPSLITIASPCLFAICQPPYVVPTCNLVDFPTTMQEQSCLTWRLTITPNVRRTYNLLQFNRCLVNSASHIPIVDSYKAVQFPHDILPSLVRSGCMV